jgi:hypothetical protein
MEPHIQYATTADGVSIAFWIPKGFEKPVRLYEVRWRGGTLREDLRR